MTTLNKELNITIVGLGVIGGSFAMALHDAGYRNLYGVDIDQATLDKAKAQRLITDSIKLAQTIQAAGFIARHPQPIARKSGAR